MTKWERTQVEDAWWLGRHSASRLPVTTASLPQLQARCAADLAALSPPEATAAAAATITKNGTITVAPDGAVTIAGFEIEGSTNALLDLQTLTAQRLQNIADWLVNP